MSHDGACGTWPLVAQGGGATHILKGDDMRHVHQWMYHCGLQASFGRTAWVPITAVKAPGPKGHDPHAHMWRCVECGEQGYEVR